jgi:hypothetical protein
MREVCFLVSRDGAVLWSDASSSPLALPDSRLRWEAIWSRRDVLDVVAHSHPVGPLAFSLEDESTMEALSSALGGRVRFAVVAPDGMLLRQGPTDEPVREEPWWARLLRLASGMT